MTDHKTSPSGHCGQPEPRPSHKHAPKFEIDFTANNDDKIPDNPFAFAPDHLHKLAVARSAAALQAFGGLTGLAYGLRTDAAAGLSLDEDVLEGLISPQSICKESSSSILTPDPKLQVQHDDAPRRRSHGEGIHGLAEQLRLERVGNRGYSDRRRVFGANKLPPPRQRTFLQLCWLAMNDKLIFLLMASATVSLALGVYQAVQIQQQGGKQGSSLEWVESVTIVAAIILIILVQALNDYHKNYKFQKLNQKKEERKVTVTRSGKHVTISVFDLLVGDLLRVEAGEVAPVDGVLVDGFGIQADESPMTGESDLVDKTPAVYVEDASRKVGGSDFDPFIFGGTKITHGVGDFLVLAVGPHSTYGRMQLSLRADVEETPLQQKLGRLAKYLIFIGFGIGIIFFLILFIRWLVHLGRGDLDHLTPQEKGEQFLDIFMLAVNLVVIGVPEGLSLAVAVALAFATTRMLRDNNLVRLLRSCEIMGNATTVCSDKTGTLTTNDMTVVTGVVGESRFSDEAGTLSTEFEEAKVQTSAKLAEGLSKEAKALLKHSIVLNSTAFEGDGAGTGDFVGSSTETALLKYGRQHLGMGPVAEERSNASVVELFPFNSTLKWMACMLRLDDGRYRMLAKGAAEVVLANCSTAVEDPHAGLTTTEMTVAMRARLSQLTRTYAANQLRVIALAYRDFDTPPMSDKGGRPGKTEAVNFTNLFSEKMTFLGLFAIRDPLRPEVIESVRQCKDAGVFVRMVTGDNFLTAKSIAIEGGIYTAGGIAMDGPTFRQLSDEQLDLVIPRLQVLARSSPEDKQVLVQHLKRMGETIAVTGDGTNDAPALKAADVGFAMGISGTEIAKEASSIILLDDNFRSIVRALAWGRMVNDASKKFLQFQLTINITAAVLTIVSTLAAGPDSSIFAVIQLLWLNLIMDIFASLALSTGDPSRDALKRRPEPRNASIISIQMWKMILGQTIYQLTVIFVLHYAGHRFFPTSTEYERNQLQTFVWNTYMLICLFNQSNCRRVDNNLHIYEGILHNPWFLGVQALTIAGQVTIVLKGGEAFQVAPITPAQWGFSILFGFLVLPIGALIRLVPDQVVVVIAHKLSPILTPIRMIRKRKAEKKKTKAKDAEKIEEQRENDAYYDERDEERRARRMQWRWVKATLAGDQQFLEDFLHLHHESEQRTKTFARKSRTSRTQTLSARVGLVSAGLAAAGVDMKHHRLTPRTGDLEAPPRPGSSSEAACAENTPVDIHQVIDAVRRNPDDCPSGLQIEVHSGTSEEDPVLPAREVLDSSAPPSQNPNYMRFVDGWS
ncbi:plasma membrane calcium-transporting ATPase [Diaporthe helianthi]|uniref:Calcium-transporting ATPase n=1 Tax=Diaporthe helianthi TaxID=158607 RepID=A0A2P5HK10_DIAHE|nr:plasma membrane calcium-transporting ATPase [Diaporthe helianthi]